MSIALRSLIQILEQDEDCLSPDNNSEIESLLRKVLVLRDILVKNPSLFDSRGHQDLESRIRDFAFQAEDEVDIHIWRKKMEDFESELDLTDVMEEFNSIHDEMCKLQTERPQPDGINPAASTSAYVGPSLTNTVVGFDRLISHLMDHVSMDQVTLKEEEMQFWGLRTAGGKTTTPARQLYDDPVMASELQSLIEILNQDTHHLCNYSILAIRSLLIHLRRVLDDYSSLFGNSGHKSSQSLTTLIRAVACRAAYQIKSHIWRIKLEDCISATRLDLSNVMEEYYYILFDMHGLQPYRTPSYSINPAPLSYGNVHPTSRNMVVGFERDICQLQGQLTSEEKKLQIIPIIGIRGSGKTTLARHLYENHLLPYHFNFRAWVMISQPFNLRLTLLDLLGSVGHTFKNQCLKRDDELGVLVYQMLRNRTYLIVVDGVCDTSTWDMLRRFFPDQLNCSRVVLTTGKWSVADFAKSSCSPHQMLPIGEDASWKLINRAVFGDRSCPPELVEIGKKIGCCCRGLPLALTKVAGILSGLSKSAHVWKKFERTWSLVHEWEEFDSVEEDKLNMPYKINPAFSASIGPSSTKVVVGFEGDISELMGKLTSATPKLCIIPIVGMGGSGKTTLARELYDHQETANCFEIRAWITISRAFDLRVTLLALLDCLVHNNVYQRSDEELGAYASKILMHKRFLIVVDDIWNATAWDKLKGFFPDEQNGSRIVITTREWSLADYAKSSSNPHQMQPIDEDASWELIIHILFGESGECPPNLLEIGRKIARNCRGRPIELTTIAGLLSKSKKTVDAWTRVESHQIYARNENEEVDSLVKEKLEIQKNSSLQGIVDLFSNKDGLQLLERLSDSLQLHELQIIPIVGVRGSGKTTLARLLYERLSLDKSFDTHAWVTISHHRDVQATLHNLLDSLRESTMELTHLNDKDIGVCVHQTLFRRRYLIVVDNIKDADTWDMLKRYFPDNNNGSRIILAAKEWNLDDYNGIKPFRLDSYWEFLLHGAFEETQTNVPRLLSTSEKIHVFWELFKKIRRPGESKSDLHLDLLLMSYNHLPHHLQPCFLYMAAFPEDYEIKTSKIVNLWIAEGFVESIPDNDLEYIAETYLMELVARNLLFVCRSEPNGKTKSVKIHDIFWKFCQKKANEENFLWFMDLEGHNIPEDEAKVRRVSVQSLSQDNDLPDLDLARSFLCIGSVSQDIDPVFLGMSLLRVLDVLQFEFVEFPTAMLQLVNLRYLAFTCCSDVPSSISIFKKLQTLVMAKASSLPWDLWKVTQLRHIKCEGTWIWHCDEFIDHDCAPENLKTLSNVPRYLLSENFLRTFPRLVKLGIHCDAMMHTTVNLSSLHKLKSLKCSATRDFLSYLIFPRGLVKLTLIYCEICSEDMCRIGILPYLEQLKLQKCKFMGEEWLLAGGQFCTLSSLQMEDLNLVDWQVDRNDFPCLERLVIRDCPSMWGIPLEIGFIETLQLLEVDESSERVKKSALKIKNEQMDNGNDLLRVVVSSST